MNRHLLYLFPPLVMDYHLCFLPHPLFYLFLSLVLEKSMSEFWLLWIHLESEIMHCTVSVHWIEFWVKVTLHIPSTAPGGYLKWCVQFIYFTKRRCSRIWPKSLEFRKVFKQSSSRVNQHYVELASNHDFQILTVEKLSKVTVYVSRLGTDTQQTENNLMFLWTNNVCAFV